MDFIHNCESGKYSSLIGWVIRLGKALKENDAQIFEFKDIIGSRINGVCPRTMNGWAVCLYFLENVCFINPRTL